MFALVMAGYVSLTYTLAYLWRVNPERAYALASGDGRITGLLAQKRLMDGLKSTDWHANDTLARLALRQDPTSLPAITAIGLGDHLRGDSAGARRAFTYAQVLSRRELQVQLWAVEDAVRRGDIASALRHYDIALRTSRNAPELMFPVLAAAISDLRIRSALVRTLASRPAWSSSLIDFLAINGPDPRATANLFIDLQREGIGPSQGARGELIGLLISKNFFDEAWSLYARAVPGAVRYASRNPRFTDVIDVPSAFDWSPITNAGVVTSIVRDSKGGVFDFSAPSSVGGQALKQSQMLPPGTYRLEGHSIGLDQPAGSEPFWAMTCYDGREIGRLVVPSSKHAKGLFSGQIIVPGGCAPQTLALILRASDAVNGVSGQIDRVQLRPIQ